MSRVGLEPAALLEVRQVAARRPAHEILRAREAAAGTARTVRRAAPTLKRANTGEVPPEMPGGLIGRRDLSLAPTRVVDPVRAQSPRLVRVPDAATRRAVKPERSTAAPAPALIATVGSVASLVLIDGRRAP